MASEDLIRSLPDTLCWRIALKLDGNKSPNWKTLITKMPKSTYNDKAILKFHSSVLSVHGSPTLELLADLGRKKTTVGQLIYWLRALENFADLVDLLDRGEEVVKRSAPTIIVQPKSDTYVQSGHLELLFDVRGDQPLSFQWFKGVNKLQNQTRNSLQLVNLRLEDSGYYTCRVSNEFGYVYTEWAKVDVCDVPYPDTFNVPLITMHPRSAHYVAGDTLRLYADAVGCPAPLLQWYHGEEALLNQCRRDLIIQNISTEHEGLYKLRASNKHGMIISLPGQVTIGKPTTYFPPSVGVDINIPEKASVIHRGPDVEPDIGFSILSPNTPSEKIALLIGNQNYDHEEKLGHLVHPVNDTHDVASALMSIDFKVVSLINLDLAAMNDALTFFYDLLGAGTYALFYFAGHGFEIDGESYLMPVNATDAYIPSENLALSTVLLAMTKKQPKLSALLLDCCRTEPRFCRLDPIPKLWNQINIDEKEINHVQRKNVIIGFGCCSKGRVLESPLMRNGFFAQCLVDHITKKIKIDDVLFEVSRAIHNEHIIDPATGRTQVVYRHSTVVDDLKLTDEAISDKSSVQSQLWYQAHIAPDSPVTILYNNYITVKLAFTAEFSNCLLIHSDITKSSDTSSCNIIFILPQTIGNATVEIISPQDKDLKVRNKFVRISNLERLSGDINIHVEVTYEENGVFHEQRAFYLIKEKPLYAKIVEQMSEVKL